MITKQGDYEIDDNPDRIDFEKVHVWLTTTYWSPGVSRDIVERAAHGSATLVGVYFENKQVAYCRVVSDKATFAWLCDVFVDDSHRKKGIAKAMVHFCLDLPYGKELRRWLLATRDAHDIYAAVGFVTLPNPDRWMVIHKQTT